MVSHHEEHLKKIWFITHASRACEIAFLFHIYPSMPFALPSSTGIRHPSTPPKKREKKRIKEIAVAENFQSTAKVLPDFEACVQQTSNHYHPHHLEDQTYFYKNLKGLQTSIKNGHHPLHVWFLKKATSHHH